jgi:RNA polymerase sigma factor (sigma-70 family)
MSDHARALIPTRRTLLSRLRQWDDAESWQEFFNTYWKLIYSVALRAGLEEAEAQDVVQETVISVARQMPNFRYDRARGSFKSWLFLITRRRINDHLRREYRRVRIEQPLPGGSSGTSRLERIADPAAVLSGEVWDEEWKRQLFDGAVRRLKARVEPKQFQIFDCYVLKGWTVSEVVKTFGVTANQVYLIKHRFSTLIAKEVAKLEHS